MRTLRILTGVVTLVSFGVVVTWAGEANGTEAKAKPAHAPTAQTADKARADALTADKQVPLVLRMLEDRRRAAPPKIEVIEPAGLQWPLLQRELPVKIHPPRTTPARNDKETAPELGAGFELTHAWSPDPTRPELHYFIYNVDLANPDIARQWTALRRAQFKQMRQERAILRGEREFRRRKKQLVAASREATFDGAALLRAGSYRAATITLTRAAEMNHGDASCRIYLALARVALGHDYEAGRTLNRALQLRPHLVSKSLGLDAYFATPEEFEGHVDALARRLAAAKSPRGEEHFVHGYLEFQRGHYDEAYAAFRKAYRTMPRDDRVRTYLSLTKPARR